MIDLKISPSVKKLVEENNIDINKILISRDDNGRITKE